MLTHCFRSAEYSAGEGLAWLWGWDEAAGRQGLASTGASASCICKNGSNADGVAAFASNNL